MATNPNGADFQVPVVNNSSSTSGSGGYETPRTHTVDGPDTYSGSFSAMPGETFNWANGSNFPELEILFVGESPVGQRSLLLGKQSVPTTAIQTTGAYLYSVHYKPGGDQKCHRKGPHTLFLAQCRGCVP
jgi:hypothetical protein